VKRTKNRAAFPANISFLEATPRATCRLTDCEHVGMNKNICAASSFAIPETTAAISEHDPHTSKPPR
jgi:hypothetical protein